MLEVPKPRDRVGLQTSNDYCSSPGRIRELTRRIAPETDGGGGLIISSDIREISETCSQISCP